MIYLTPAPNGVGTAVKVQGESSAFYMTPSPGTGNLQAAVSPELIGPQIPINELAIGDFVLTVSRSKFVSGKVNAISRSGAGETTLELVQNLPHYPGAYARIDVEEPRAIFRVEPEELELNRGWFERTVLKKPVQHYYKARTVAEILNQPMEPMGISLEDQGRSVIIPSLDGRVWKVRTIKTAKQDSEAFRIYFADGRYPDSMVSHHGLSGFPTIEAIILR